MKFKYKTWYYVDITDKTSPWYKSYIYIIPIKNEEELYLGWNISSTSYDFDAQFPSCETEFEKSIYNSDSSNLIEKDPILTSKIKIKMIKDCFEFEENFNFSFAFEGYLT